MILDTNALSAFVDEDDALLDVIRDAAELALPVIVLGEFRFGIATSRRRLEYENWLARDLRLFHVLAVEEHTAAHYAAIRSELKTRGTPIPANDAWIAALARQKRLPIVSRDVHFDSVRGLMRLSW